MSIQALSFNDICKSNNEFSFLSTIFDLVGNKQYKSTEYDALIQKKDDVNTHTWISLSAIGQEIGGVFQQNVNNFIDNLLNADTCGTIGLQSLADMLGINYTIFSTVNDFPLEIRKLIDVLSIKKEYLLNIDQINKKFAQYLCAECSSTYEYDYAKDVVQSINKYRTSIYDKYHELSSLTYANLSSQWHTENDISNHVQYTYAPSAKTIATLSSDALNNIIYDIFYEFIMSKLKMTYNDYENTYIYQTLSDNIILSNFTLINDNIDEIQKIKLQYNIRSDFDASTEADNIDDGLSTLDDYSESEKKALDIEFEYRQQPYNTLQLQTRNKYYKEIEVKQYFDYIRNEYLSYDTSYLSASTYNIDQEYFVLRTDYDSSKSLLSSDGSMKTNWISAVVDELTYITDNIRQLREQMKYFCQKNFMKGTFLIISYLINEYMKSNIKRSLDKLQDQKPELFNKDPKFEYDSNYNSLVEYLDPVQYFNICAECDIGRYVEPTISSELNPRYWQVNSTVEAIGAIDTTDVFSIPPTINANTFAFDLATLSSFYYDVMNQQFKQYSISKLTGTYTDHLSKFLSYIYDVGADQTYRDEDGELVFNIEDNELSTYKKDLYFRYTANADSEFPFYYYSNTYHPSYQIHPYLSSFMEKVDYSYPIENIATVARDSIIELVKKNLASYIDEDGYLQNMWNNPLGANQDYLSRYESVEHIDQNNDTNPVLGYDGLFYPPAIVQLKTTTSFKIMIEMLKNNLKDDSTLAYGQGLKNYYYHLGLTQNERNKICNQLTALRTLLLNVAFDNDTTTICRYGLDMYQNAYILTKSTVGIKSKNDLKNANGILWYRIKNHPIAFPACVMTEAQTTEEKEIGNKNYIANNTYSNLNFDIAESCNTNNVIWRNATYLADLLTSVYKTPLIKDFTISLEHQNIAILEDCTIAYRESMQYVLIGEIQIQYDINDDINYHRFVKIQSDVEFLFSNKELDDGIGDYKFGCFFNIFNKLAVCMYQQYDSSTLYLIGNYYDYDNSKEPIHDISRLKVDLKNYRIKDGTNIVFDANNDNNLVLGYVVDATTTKATNYLDIDLNYSEISSYLSRPLDKCIALKTYYVYNTFSELDIDSDSANDSTALFESYTDNGFFGILSGQNFADSSQLTYELSRRGILKFQLLGEKKQNPIDFNFTIPVRMREGYKTHDVVEITTVKHTITCASYEYAHFDEDVLSAKDKSIAETVTLKYDPVEVSKVLNGKSAGLMVDEDYFKQLSDSVDNDTWLYKQLAVGPYLIVGDIPEEYVTPGKQTYQADGDNFCLTLLPTHTPISCSWYRNDKTNDIQLDFNTAYYNKFDGKNFYNQQYNFLTLAKAGDAGYLNTYTSSGDQDTTYYIKNISDNYPKFILSAFAEADVDRQLMTQDGKLIETQENQIILI